MTQRHWAVNIRKFTKRIRDLQRLVALGSLSHQAAEFAWWIDGMTQWVDEGRILFAPGDLAALWPTERRTRVSLEYLDRRFTALRREAGLDPALSLHCLRHSYVTHLIEYGYADRFVQEQVGHRHSSTTSIYTSVSGDFKNRILADALRRFNALETP